jgi:AhpD family alkylhydroperoxidase
MARVPFRTPDLLEPAASANVFRALGNSPQMVAGMANLGGRLLTRGSLDARTRELVILRVGALLRCDYEFGQHVLVAQGLGVADEEIRAVRGGDLHTFDGRVGAALQFADAVEACRVDDSTFAAVRQEFGPEELVELTVLVGYYGAVCRFLLALEVDLDDGLRGLEHP